MSKRNESIEDIQKEIERIMGTAKIPVRKRIKGKLDSYSPDEIAKFEFYAMLIMIFAIILLGIGGAR